MVLTNAERQKKYRENKLKSSGNRHRRLQLIIDDKTNIELSSIIFRHVRLNAETNTSEHPVTKQDVIAAAIHKYALELGVEYDLLPDPYHNLPLS